MLIFGEQLRSTLAKRHRFTATYLHLPEKKYPYSNEQKNGKRLDQESNIPRLSLFGTRRDFYPFFPQSTDNIGIFRSKGTEAVVIAEFATNDSSLNSDLSDLSLFHSGKELTEDDLRFLWLLRIKNLKDEQEDQP